MPSSLFFLVIALAVLAAVVVMLRSKLLREKYAVLWVIVGLLVVVLAVFPSLLEVLAGAVGIAVPSNLLFALAILMLLGVTLHLSLEASRIDEEARTLSEESAILRLQVEKLSADVDRLRQEREPPGSVRPRAEVRRFDPGVEADGEGARPAGAPRIPRSPR